MTDPRRSYCHNADGSPKGTFLDKRDAKKIVRLVSKRTSYRSGVGPMHLYRCPLCRYWHLGHDVGHDNAGGDAA